MVILGVESSCDETSVAVVLDGRTILSNITYTQIKEHTPFYGVVPEIASRLHLEKINRIFESALAKANITINDVDIVGVVNRPGLVGSLMVGASFAKTVAFYYKKPIITINHLIAHLYANFLTGETPAFPYIGLIVSGGHTLLLIAYSHYKYKVVGTTLDDAVGEAYDKVAKLLNIGYPGGPAIDKILKDYEGEFIKFTPGLLRDKKNKYNFSYSGLKTAVLNYITKNKDFNLKSLLLGFQKAAIEVIYYKTKLLSNETGIKEIVIAGGVSANSYLREIFQNDNSLNVYIPPLNLCTDNAAMVASYAYFKAKNNEYDGLDFDVSSRQIQIKFNT